MMYRVISGRVHQVEPMFRWVGKTLAEEGEYDTCPELIKKVHVIDLHEIISKKITEIEQLADTEKTQGFNSDALGTVNHYYNHGDFPRWYRDTMMVQNSANRKDTVAWMVVTETGMEMVEHTAEQFDQVFTDLISFEQPIEYKRLSLTTQVSACTTKEELDSITW